MEKDNNERREIWIGTLEVSPFFDSKLLADVTGAWVNVLTWASDSAEFRMKANELMDYLHLQVDSIEAAEPLVNRGNEDQLDAEIVHIANEVRDNGEAIRYSTFHTWGESTKQ